MNHRRTGYPAALVVAITVAMTSAFLSSPAGADEVKQEKAKRPAMPAAVAGPHAPAVGDIAPDFSLVALGGEQTIKLSEVVAEPKPVVLVVLRGFPGYQ